MTSKEDPSPFRLASTARLAHDLGQPDLSRQQLRILDRQVADRALAAGPARSSNERSSVRMDGGGYAAEIAGGDSKLLRLPSDQQDEAADQCEKEAETERPSEGRDEDRRRLRHKTGCKNGETDGSGDHPTPGDCEPDACEREQEERRGRKSKENAERQRQRHTQE